MANITLITQSEFATKRWKRPSGYGFAAKDAAATLVMQEIPKAAVVQPIGFMLNGEIAAPVSIQGIQPGHNLLVSPEGQWHTGYIPAVYRMYPFSLAQGENDQHHLCFDMDSGLIDEAEGELFFDEKGDPSEAVKQVLNFLIQVHKNRQMTKKLCETLQQFELIEPWPITLKDKNGEKKINGLHRINETRLNQLDVDSFQTVRQAGALPLIYCQLLSIQQLPNLLKLVRLDHGNPEESAKKIPDLEQLFAKGEDIFHF